ncbi:MAG: folylpolyglutamate synthase/dihydrofolate synthase [Erysipelotrichaceae bacterium]|nr:folylpolyglutamate synthase/dihydrofolate synthase [Erysipelotrichaceae bacterium]
MFKTAKEVYDFIDMQKDRVYSLDNFKKYMNFMNNPQNKLKCIHIGGTNGKGSTTNYITHVLMMQGYHVGTFTSPYLETPLDSICINQQNIEEKFIVDLANQYMNQWLEFEISKFEIEVFIAITYFISQKVDYAIFEVGLGGELDATNIIMPLVAINTNIGLDHVAFLGDSYEQIAQTKAGIIKTKIDYITGETKKECLDIFNEVCRKHQSKLIQVKKASNIKQNPFVSFDYENYHIELNTLALYQVKNASLALEVLLYLKHHDYIELNDQSIIKGFKKAYWKGRYEIMRKDPLVIIDGAHNDDGIKMLIESSKNLNHIKVIFTALKDKSTHNMIKLLLTLTDDIVITEFDFYRAKKAEELAEDFNVKICKDWQKAVDDGLKHQGPLIITGSLYFIKEVRKYLLKKGEATTL